MERGVKGGGRERRVGYRERLYFRRSEERGGEL